MIRSRICSPLHQARLGSRVRLYTYPEVAALVEQNGDHPDAARTFAHILLDHTLLVRPRDSQVASEWASAIRAMPADLQMLWSELLKAVLLPAAVASSFQTSCGCPTIQGSACDLRPSAATTQESQCQCGCIHYSWTGISSSRSVRDLITLARSPIADGDDREDVFRQRIEPLSRSCSRVYIIDRYLGKTLRLRVQLLVLSGCSNDCWAEGRWTWLLLLRGILAASQAWRPVPKLS